MDISLQLAFDEGTSLITLNVLAQHDAKLFYQYDAAAAREGRKPLDSLYESGIVYEREQGEIWGDVLNTLMEGHEDCDALAAIRAGELMARGALALHPGDPNDPVKYPGDGGYIDAMEWGMTSIPAEVMLKTNATDGRPGLYHCIVRYWVPDIHGTWLEYRDDPSARLGMNGGSQEAQQGLSGARLAARAPTRAGAQSSFYRGIALSGPGVVDGQAQLAGGSAGPERQRVRLPAIYSRDPREYQSLPSPPAAHQDRRVHGPPMSAAPPVAPPPPPTPSPQPQATPAQSHDYSQASVARPTPEQMNPRGERKDLDHDPEDLSTPTTHGCPMGQAPASLVAGLGQVKPLDAIGEVFGVYIPSTTPLGAKMKAGAHLSNFGIPGPHKFYRIQNTGYCYSAEMRSVWYVSLGPTLNANAAAVGGQPAGG